MQQKRTHRQNAASRDLANNLRVIRSPTLYPFCAQNAVPMRPRQNLQRAVVRIAIIKVQPQSDHPPEDLRRRLHMLNPLLLRPGSETGDGFLFKHRNGQVLMPLHLPIRPRLLIKEDAANQKCAGSAETFQYFRNFSGFSQPRYRRRHPGQISDPRRVADRQAFHGSNKLI